MSDCRREFARKSASRMETRFQKIIEMKFKNLKSDLYTLKPI